ncbi:toxic anion resistance protein [Cellulosilyticum lentocellum]|uniref:Toxic anion resistance family protein n=1 Tax=Cellulosilyticum lentocellum (strain ATCC 49066 / DSM 5427 / NCIMB 11756 / RHM5) TaxID=642492 RepID=F2JM78_CELLD|nr:toxic anion resistance protein [Cellulosilyticum lentocellum]ADZ82289.1 toxic anion resistance family protein [Cellulosilyticum lentocellum DSM 5427]
MDFSMEVVDGKAVEEEVIEQIKPEPQEVVALKNIANQNVANLVKIDMTSLEERSTVLKGIEEFGLETIRKSSEKNSLLQVPIKDLSKLGGEGSEVAEGLVALQREMKNLDPSLIDFSKTGFLGKLFNPIRAYFEKYQKADSVINDIVASLERGKNTLKNDNTTLEIEEVALRDLTKKLAKEIEMGSFMDEAISQEVDKARSANEDADKIRFISEEVLFPLRQRIMDMQQMIIVNQQGIMAIEVIRRNNKELIRGVERAKNVTISALRIATMVASALYNQKIVLKKIEMLNETTNQLISGTANMLKQQGADIHKQSMEANVSVETLKSAFSDTMAALEAISTYKQEALPKMKETIAEFRELAEKGEKEIQKLEKNVQLESVQ